MNEQNIVQIEVAGIKMKFSFPMETKIPNEFHKFIKTNDKETDVEYVIRLLESPLEVSEKEISDYRGMKVYSCNDGSLRIFSSLVANDGCQVACLLNQNQKHILYYPASKWEFYAQELHFLHLIGIEEVLIKKGAFLLHSSVVQMNGQMVLFSGPSGIGKSTQSQLWEKKLGAEIINGDRCIIRKKNNVFWGSGSPWCGTSGIYRNEMAPIKGIFILKQSTENRVRRLGAEAFSLLYQQSIVNMWDEGFVEKITDLIIELLLEVPVYELSCRPEEEAVLLAYQTLFEGGI